jgi:Lactonase, 7-bladed beta-propeller
MRETVTRFTAVEPDRKEESISQTPPNATASGAVYVQTNTAPNEVIAFRRSEDGSLERVGGVATGSEGAGSPHLQSQGSVALTSDGQHLLVTNAASDDLSVFSVATDGSLELRDRVHTATTPMNGVINSGCLPNRYGKPTHRQNPAEDLEVHPHRLGGRFTAEVMCERLVVVASEDPEHLIFFSRKPHAAAHQERPSPVAKGPCRGRHHGSHSALVPSHRRRRDRSSRRGGAGGRDARAHVVRDYEPAPASSPARR